VAKNRKQYSAKKKMEILRLHLVEKKPGSDICDEFGVHPTLFYRWQQTLFEKGESAFDQSVKNGTKAQAVNDKEISVLREKLKKKGEVLGEVMEEFVKLKKERGAPESGLGAPRYTRPDCRFH